MAKRVNLVTKQKKYKHFTVDPVTGKVQWFFPMEIEVDVKDYEKGSVEYETAVSYLNNLKVQTVKDENGNEVVCEVGEAKLGFREFLAVFVPVTHDKYLELIKDEMNKQEDMKQDGRCPVTAKIGGVKTCPARIPNPDYVEGGNMPKTIANSCENCIYRSKKHEHTEVNFSTLSATSVEDDTIDYEAETPSNYYEGERYERLVEKWQSFVKKNSPEDEELAVLLAMEYLRSEAARELGMASSTAQSRREKLKPLLLRFLEEVDE